jgi:hypothetical protein
MAYASWSVVFGEQPSAAKWNTLGTNDAYFNTQIGSGFSSSTSSTVWWEELGRSSLSGTADAITISSISARKYLKIIISAEASGQTNLLLRFNNDTAGNYASRYSTSGAADATTTADTVMTLATAETTYKFAVVHVVNDSTKEKLIVGQTVSSNTAGAGNAPGKWEFTGKWANTSNQVTRVDVINTGAGDFATGSLCLVLGHD